MREKRKTRLNKTSAKKGEFIGFDAFAGDNTLAMTQMQVPPPNSQSKKATLQLTPVYTGKDIQLTTMVFPRLLKRDATTKVKALQALQQYFQDDSNPRKNQVDALAHYLYLYFNKLHYDHVSSVRAGALQTIFVASQRVPKAFQTLASQQTSIFGMVLCCRGDPAAEVRIIATTNVPELEKLVDTSNLREGVWLYMERIVGYKRPKAMYDDLFASKQTQKDSQLSEVEKDQMQEAFERILAAALNGFDQWLRSREWIDAVAENSPDFLWANLNSPKPSIRRQIYQLLGTCCRKSPTPLSNEVLHQGLLSALSSEKEPSNIPILLEGILTFLSSTTNPWNALDPNATSKQFVKLFKKACHGSSAAQWGPTLLPLLAMVPTTEDQIAILSAACKGRGQTVGLADELIVLETVAECASFFLLRRGVVDAQIDMDDAKRFGLLWLEVFSAFLETQLVTNVGLVRKSYDRLGQALAKQLGQFDDASFDREACGIYLTRDWFWTEAMLPAILKANGNATTALVLQNMTKHKKGYSPTAVSHLVPILREKFTLLLKPFQESSGEFPSEDIYDLFIAITAFCGVGQLFLGAGESSFGTETFLMKDILRWMIVHTTALSSTQRQSIDLVRKDFVLVGMLLPSFALEKQRVLWNALMREVIAAKCDLGLFTKGLGLLCQQESIDVRELNCDSIDKYAITVVQDLVREAEDGDSEHSNTPGNPTTKHFLQLCTGQSSESDVPLVGHNVLESWVEIVCPEPLVNDEMPECVLEILLNLLSKDSMLNPKEVQKVLTQTWSQGGSVWSETAVKCIQNDISLLVPLQTCASEYLEHALRDFCSEPVPATYDPHSYYVWARQGWRLLEVSLLVKDGNDDEERPAPSLGLVGLTNIDLWRSQPSILFLCGKYVLQHFPGTAQRLELIKESRNNVAEFLNEILIALSEADHETASVELVKKRMDRCAQFLKYLGGKEIERELLEDLCRTCLASVASAAADKNYDLSRKGLAVLSQLFDLMFMRIVPINEMTGQSDLVTIEDLHEGYKLWYIPDAQKPEVRTRAEIVKVHIDLAVGNYFTIRVGGEERQTILERLRNTENPPMQMSVTSYSKMTSEEISSRREWTGSVLQVVMPVISIHLWRSGFPEALSLVASQVGLGMEKGIGSTKYQVFQMVSSIASPLIEQLRVDTASKESIVDTLWTIASICGCGVVSPESLWSSQFIGFDPVDITSALFDFWDRGSIQRDGEIDRAVLNWLVTFGRMLQGGQLEIRATKLLYEISGSQLQVHGDSATMLGLRAIHRGNTISQSSAFDSDSCVEEEGFALKALIMAFSSHWEDYAHNKFLVDSFYDDQERHTAEQPVWRSSMEFDQIIASSLTNRKHLMIPACVNSAEGLSRALFVASKRWYAFRLLDTGANIEHPLIENGIANTSTKERLEQWTIGLDEEEAEILEEDIDIASRWLPANMMNEIESWSDENMIETLEVDVAIGRMLTWLCALRYLDAAAPRDPLNRPAFCSFFIKCDAVVSILNLAMVHMEVNKKGGSVVDPLTVTRAVLEDEEAMELGNLASLVFFRTVKVLPTLTRRWWEEECPKANLQSIRGFVEEQVAPAILRSELERIKEATFGEMSVRGSTVSREVTALYEQDDFQLSVLVKLPPSFPLRSAEVDCSKTLGIPQKRWKLWALQITQMLNSQGGSLQDALTLWKENVDKEFEGVEPCPVCYSVLHVKTHKLPELECRTCQHRFHVECLNQWFRSSGKSQCVLCQQPWSGIRVRK